MQLLSQFPHTSSPAPSFPALTPGSYTAEALSTAVSDWTSRSASAIAHLDRIERHVRSTIRRLIDADSTLAGALHASH